MNSPESRPDAVITTERLIMRPLTLDYTDLLVELQADPRVHRFTPSFTHEQARERLAGIERQWATRGHGLCAVELKETGEFLGRCGLNHWEEFDEVEAGWTLRPAVWGHGYATEAARACVEWGFAHLDVPYLTSMIAPANTGSARVAERLGFAPSRQDTFLGKDITVYTRHRD
ncbi:MULTISPECIES: GNAT family N-acetyltransferase [unclassified Streptomyces]|uniref:GNAT family N-acetyltransferase n=1 Tax=unclassified Streptomyces TaxID=2593676 RepID=UPI002DD88720|nr:MULTISPECIES: GNAT family N-acetyltransferase [unclassified Streptomyces]WSA91248.1 GNAT family N-acetyltransferase [Streptomyces sp. NBC_01795]WSB75572.1 GNAT family N-acetyltransferase [Streptomyces sp. NBC_01775]WSS16143.1 GNAT family N-acetyltransferase [Streptomyces sp. NBC_01186]WSS44962.1 GNAT family N-acetyltransferase [Streptomyces sp. NBC_01187]